jgi:outer membrane autotransporter protein
MNLLSFRTIAALSVAFAFVTSASHAEEQSQLSVEHGIMTSAGTDAKSQAPGALTAKYGLGVDKAFKPYIGAGLGYAPTSPAENKLGDAGTGFKTGVAYQFGFDYKLDEKSSLNFDYKHLSIPSDVKHGGNESTPSLLGFGLNVKF